MQYLTARKLNTSDDKIIANFRNRFPEVIDQEDGICGLRIVKLSNVK